MACSAASSSSGMTSLPSMIIAAILRCRIDMVSTSSSIIGGGRSSRSSASVNSTVVTTTKSFQSISAYALRRASSFSSARLFRSLAQRSHAIRSDRSRRISRRASALRESDESAGADLSASRSSRSSSGCSTLPYCATSRLK